jgi:hypothetical protein
VGGNDRRGPAVAATVARTFDAPKIATVPQPASQPVPSLDAPVAATASAPPVDAPPVVAKIAVDSAVVPLVVDAPIDARPTVVAIAPADAMPLGIVPQKPIPTKPLKPVPSTSKQSTATEGTLLVKVLPFADVVIDGVEAGTSPVLKKLSVGAHTVLLVGPNNRTETISVTINAAKQTLVSRKW